MNPTSPRCPKRIHPASNQRRGVAALFVVVSLAVMIAICSLAINLSWLTSHQVELRDASEAAALAGAAQLHDPVPGSSDSAATEAAASRAAAATTQAQTFFNANSTVVLQTTGTATDIAPGWCEDPITPGATVSAWSGGTNSVNSLSVRGMRRRANSQAVPIWFGNFFSVQDAEPAAAATASMDQRIYGFRPLELVNAPVIPMLVMATAADWPSAATWVGSTLPDNYSVIQRTGVVTSGTDSIHEITLLVSGSSGTLSTGQAGAVWLNLTGGTTDYTVLEQQIENGLAETDLAGIGGELALGVGGTLSVSSAALPTSGQTAVLQDAFLGIRGKKRVWPIGNVTTVDNQQTYRITGFVAGVVVDCSMNSDDALVVVVQACTIQTCTGLLRSGMSRNPWIGKLILNE